MCSTCAESAAGMACNRVSGAGGCAASCRCEHANRDIPESRTSPTLMRRNLPITGLSYLTITGASFFAAQISATNHPMMLHPRKRLSRKIASKSRLLRASAMIDGKKYNKNGKPKNGKKRTVDRIMTALLVYSLALSGTTLQPRSTGTRSVANHYLKIRKTRYRSSPVHRESSPYPCDLSAASPASGPARYRDQPWSLGGDDRTPHPPGSDAIAHPHEKPALHS